MRRRTPKPERQSQFFHDLATPVSGRRGGRGKFTTPGQVAAVSDLWRENFANSDLAPPPAFTLEDRFGFLPEYGIPDYTVSPEVKSDPRTPVLCTGRDFSTLKSKSEAGTSNAIMGRQQRNQQGTMLTVSWWSPTKSGGRGEQEDKGKGSPVEGVVQPGALVTVPPPREVARLEMQRKSLPVGNLDEEEWVTVYGFSPGDTTLVMQEFEKCGVILKHVPGPGNANWMDILYQNRSDAQKALSRNGMQINGELLIGVKPVDPVRSALNAWRASPQPCYIPRTTDIPAKSVVSKIMDLMFGPTRASTSTFFSSLMFS